MSSFPELHEVIWLFEVEPSLEAEDLGWPMSPATFEFTRGATRVHCTIAPYDYTVDIRCETEAKEAFALRLNENVDTLTIDRTHGAETLVIECRASAQLWPVRLQLKPHMTMSVATRRSWERA